MKVELSNSYATQELTSRSKVTASTVTSTGVAAQDKTSFSQKTQSVQTLVNQALSSPEIRQDRVQALKASITSGEYKLDANKIAGAIISEGGK